MSKTTMNEADPHRPEEELHPLVHLTPSQDVYLHDGNIVLVAEDTAFLVHESILQRHSEVFRDMIEVTHLPEGSETFDEHPVVRLSDSKQDVSELLLVLYDNLKLRHTKLDQLSSVLRLSTKYLMDSMRASAVEELCIAFPDKLCQWDRGERAPTSDACRVVQLAHEVKADVLLPAAYYALCGLPTTEVFADEHISRQTLQTYSLGKEALYSRVSNFFLSIGSSNRVYGLARCTDDCTKAWPVQKWERRFRLVSSCLDPLWEMQNLVRVDSFPTLCPSCRKKFYDRIQTEREALWESLPSTFQLGDWESLRSE